MILDERTEFCDAVALNTSATDTQNIGDIIDLTVDRDIGQQIMYLVIQVDTAIAGTSSTVEFRLVSDSTDSISTSTATIHARTFVIPEATLVAGFQMIIPIPAESPAYERYIGIQTVIGTANLTAGKINAFLTLDPNSTKTYADATN